jgi:hypothetical protein
MKKSIYLIKKKAFFEFFMYNNYYESHKGNCAFR